MVYNENGIIINTYKKYVTIGETKIDISSFNSILNESYRRYLDKDKEYKNKIKELEDIIKSCDDKYINKLNDYDKVETLSSKAKQIISILTIVTGSGMVLTGVGGTVSLIIGKDKLCGILMAALGVLSVIAFTLLTIMSVNSDKEYTNKINKEQKIIDVASEVRLFLQKQALNTKLPKSIRDEASLNADKIKDNLYKIENKIRDAKLRYYIDKKNEEMQMKLNIMQQQMQQQQVQNQINQANNAAFFM